MLSYEALECSHQHKKKNDERKYTVQRRDTKNCNKNTCSSKRPMCVCVCARVYCVFERPNMLSTHFLLNSCLIYLFYFCLSLSFCFSAVINVVVFFLLLLPSHISDELLAFTENRFFFLFLFSSCALTRCMNAFMLLPMNLNVANGNNSRYTIQIQIKKTRIS